MAMQPLEPVISAVVCTRNRGAEVETAIKTILSNRHPDFEIIVVDQSTNNETEDCIQQFLSNSRFHYIRTPTCGVGIARNIGLNLAKADVVAYTDDDCTVSENWLSTIEQIFQSYPRVGVVFCSVNSGPYDSSIGLIPSYCYPRDKLIRSLLEYYQGIGMGAGMAVRKSAVIHWGGFDEALGPGSPLRSAEDHDLALRALMQNQWVYELAGESVTHHGFRTYPEFVDLTRRDWYAIGAVHAKFVKRMDVRILPLLFYNTLIRGIWQPFARIFQGKRPQGFKRFFYYWQGFLRGIRIPLDHDKLTYRLADQQSSHSSSTAVQP